jgi:hypothetical protein
MMNSSSALSAQASVRFKLSFRPTRIVPSHRRHSADSPGPSGGTC